MTRMATKKEMELNRRIIQVTLEIRNLNALLQRRIEYGNRARSAGSIVRKKVV
jgi:hypothetical protein